MQIIISHKNTDFDGFAAQVAATILYPRARILLSCTLERNVREFLTIYRHALPIIREEDIAAQDIKRIIIVDTQIMSRLGALKAILQRNNSGELNFEVVIYDHHTEFKSDIKSEKCIVKAAGSTTTILIEEIKNRQIELSSLQATLLGLGVYEDTGIFTFSSTTYEDFEATAYLAKRGMKLNVIMDFVNRELTAQQLALLNELINNSESEFIKGVNIVFSYAQVDKYIVDISLVAHKLRDIENINVLFIIILTGNKAHIIGRSRLINVDVDGIMRYFNGGGHPQAASATLRESASYEEIKHRILEVCRREIISRLVASEIMQHGFKIVRQDIKVYDAFRIMMLLNLDALPVSNISDEHKIVGVIRKTDVEKAFHHKLQHSRVKGFMSDKIFFVPEYASIEQIEHTLIENDIGIVFVKNDEGKIVGIVTRDILLKTIYNMKKKNYSLYSQGNVYCYNYRYLMEERLPAAQLDLLQRIGREAENNGWNAYIVGGVVRDLFLPPRYIKSDVCDIDIVVESKKPDEDKAFGILLAQLIYEKGIITGQLVVHDKFKTAKIFYKKGRRVDFSTARTEFYSMPAALPEVNVSSIKQDLYRRDFTVNGMAMSINTKEFGRLYDFFNGLKDIREHRLRILYSLSFIDDPTRIFRAVRFEQRYGFKLDHNTKERMADAIRKGFLNTLANQRVRDEFFKILDEDAPYLSILRMQELHILKTLDEDIIVNRETIRQIEKITLFRKHYGIDEISEYITPPSWHDFYFYLIFRCLPEDKLRVLLRSFSIAKKDIKKILAIYRDIELTARRLISERKASEIYRILNWRSETFICFLYLFYEVKEQIMRYLKHLLPVKPYLTGGDIVNMGIKPGPAIRELIKELTYMQLDGKIRSMEEAQRFVRTMI